MSDFKNEWQQAAPEEGSGFTLLEQGEYEAELSDVKLDLTKEPHRLTAVYVVTDERYPGRKLFGNYQLSGRGLGFLKKDLVTLGLDFSKVGSAEDVAALFWDILPAQVIVFVNQKEWQGKTYNNVYLNSLMQAPAHKPTARPQQKAAPPTGQPRPRVQPTPRPSPKANLRQPQPSVDLEEASFDDASEIPF